ncbi:MAG: T9SS type A sorting domain-containing protein [Bacteroidota bacterium]|nr:T9SS type A sorting domain-containing protein [Bacteroidota bacterium]
MDSPNFQTTYPILCNNGYLSDAVFEAIVNNHKAPRPKIAAILIQNSPLPDDILKMANNSTYLKNGHKKQIRKVQAGTNPRLLLEYEMADIKQEIASIESKMLIHAINNDSVPAYREDVMNYFSHTADVNIENYMNRFNLHMAKNDYAEARNILDALRKHALNLNDDSISLEVQRYCDVHDMLISVLKNTQNEKIELEQHLAFLRQAAQGFSPWYSGVAETLYEIATDSVFLEYTPLPQPEITPKNMVAEQDDDIFTPELNVYPNPTKDELYVEYNFQSETGNGNYLLLEEMGHKQTDDCTGGEIAVYTIEGKIIFRKNLNQASGIEIINMNDYKPANYVIEIKDCYGFSKEHKIVKQ